jgi:succinate dehydrogenase flavin-adding protein (antitoxin of CptAB toxin-antitoxin module)
MLRFRSSAVKIALRGKPALPGLRKIGSRFLSVKGSAKDAESISSERDQQLRKQHESLTLKDDSMHDEVRRRRMIYRSKQRGWLEVDLLLGSWAEKFVPKLSAKELDEYDLILREETIDIFNYISGKDPLPVHLQNLKVLKDIQAYAISSKVIDPESYAKLKKENRLT